MKGNYTYYGEIQRLTEFMIVSIYKIKLTQEKIKSLNIDFLENQIKEAKEKMDL